MVEPMYENAKKQEYAANNNHIVDNISATINQQHILDSSNKSNKTHNDHHHQQSKSEHHKNESDRHRNKDRNHHRENNSERTERKERERLEKAKGVQKHKNHNSKKEDALIQNSGQKKSKEHKNIKKETNNHQEPSTSSAEHKEIQREKFDHHQSSSVSAVAKKEEKPHKEHNKREEKYKEHKHEKPSSSSSSSRKDNKHKSSKHEQKSSVEQEKSKKRESNLNIIDEVIKKRPKPTLKVEDTVDNLKDDGFDSSMGANFEDVLGALNMPAGSGRKLKKPTSNAQIPSNTNSKSSEGASISRRSSVNNSTPEELQKPVLLTSAANLQPLDPNLALDLPTISNNYRPMPLNKTVMDCVFNTNNSSVVKAPARMFSDSEALAHGISSKTMRTKMYSGVKSGQVFQVPSLFNLCIRILQKNIDALEYTGGVPFEVLKAVLERATPEQLYMFEEYNPYILDDSDELWKLHVQRKYRTQKRQEMETWRDMFLRCKDDEAIKLSRLTETIKQKEKIISAPIKKTQMAFVDSLVKPPRNVARKQEIYGTRAKPTATPAARVAALSNVTPNAASIGDVRLRVAASTSRDTAQATSSGSRTKKAPLMAKTLQFMRGRLKR